jgi:glycosyltransferase involved in cell wall biosynthesis
MQIGIVHSDLNNDIGGGQTFFQSLINSSNHEFTFPIQDAVGIKNKNYVSKPLVNNWQRYCHKLDFSKVTTPRGFDLDGRQSDILSIFDMLNSFGSKKLDIIEIPDYLPYAAFIPAACNFLGIKVEKFVLSMHGTLSMALADNWVKFGGDLNMLRFFEDALYNVVDIRYGISPSYTSNEAMRLSQPAYLLDVKHIFSFPDIAAPTTSDLNILGKSTQPDIMFIGRHEKWKGPDIFIDLVSKMPKTSYGQAKIIGPSVKLDGTDSVDFLKKMAEWRGLDVQFEVLKRDQLIQRMRTDRAIAVFPSRIDTFNLTALEALMNGCPCAISQECGIVDYLEKAFPGIPYIKIGSGAAVDRNRIEWLLSNYDEAKRNLIDYLRNNKAICIGMNIDEIYNMPSTKNSETQVMLQGLFEKMIKQMPQLYEMSFSENRSILETEINQIISYPKLDFCSSFKRDPHKNIKSTLFQSASPKAIAKPIARNFFAKLIGRINPLFDEQWYLDQNQDVRNSGANAYSHYCLHGALEGRKPNVLFDGAWYLENYHDVYAAQINPLDHYVSFGASEGREPNAWFNSKAYRAEFNLAQTDNPVLHFLKSGKSLPLDHLPKTSRENAIDINRLLAINDVSIDLLHDINSLKDKMTKGQVAFAPVSSEILAGLNRHSFSGDRVSAYQFAAELERERGNDVLCATYHLRALRLSGKKDTVGTEMVASLLEKTGYAQEAQAARLLYGHSEPAQITDYLNTQRKKMLTWSGSDLAEIIDQRTIDAPRVSIIVSVYNGVTKIGNFLQTLWDLTEKSRGSVELVLVDSASPDGTGDWIKKELEQRQFLPSWMSIVYARSEERETIQKAWNRGINLAHGKYYAFMGVDESNRPDGYDLLADYLDQNPSVDWVVSDAVVQDVDMNCAYVNDVMIYRRKIDSKNDHLLECCYMSYVGCLYRADIHKRFGYYDETFRAAGDTEFKNRILRDANFGYLEDCIGFFNNYPEERVTQSPLAELEDLRAWYLHRSVGGLLFRFERSQPDEIIKLFIRALDYKKSYMDRRCTDLELASNLAKVLELKFPLAYQQVSEAAIHVNEALSAYRMLDNLIDGSLPFDLANRRNRIIQAAEKLINSYDNLIDMGKDVQLDFLSDNRSHQHNNIWHSIPQAIEKKQKKISK